MPTDEYNNLMLSSGVSFDRDQYLLNKIFHMPHHSGPKKAVAIDQNAEITLVAVYTLLVTGVFIAIWILIAAALSRLLPKVCSKQDAFRAACDWEITEPIQAMIVMGTFCWPRIKLVFRQTSRMLQHILFQRKPTVVISLTGIGGTATNLDLLRDLFFGVLIILIAIAVVVGGIIAGIYLPEKLIIGHVAPVNPKKIFLWNCFQTKENVVESNVKLDDLQSRIQSVMDRHLARAVGMVDSSTLELDEKLLTVMVNPVELPTGEQSYDIHYSFNIADFEMGLQMDPGLVFQFEGECRFEYTWYKGTYISSTDEGTIMYDRYFPWGDRNKPRLVDLNSTCATKDPWYDLRLQRDKVEPISTQGPGGEFYLNKLAQGRGTRLPSRDPWYLTGQYLNHGFGGEPWECTFFKNQTVAASPGEISQRYPYNEISKYRVKPGRPMLRCKEQMTASFSGVSSRIIVPRVRHNPSIEPFTPADLAQWVSISRAILHPYGIILSPAVEMVFAVNIALYTPLIYHIAGHSSVLGPIAGDLPHVLDGASNSGFADIKRVVSAGYTATRNMFRNTAIGYKDIMMPPEAINNHTLGLNILVNATTGEPLSGSGEFVLPSHRVTTLSLEILVGIPVGLAAAFFLVFCLWLWGKKRGMERCPECGHTRVPAEVDGA